MQQTFITVCFLFLQIFALYSQKVKNPHSEISSKGKVDTMIILRNNSQNINVYLKYPLQSRSIGTIILLPGWNLPVSDWCTKTTLCQKALSMGYILIMPEMAKSIYASERFPETRKDWLQYATRSWFIDTFLVFVQQKYKLLLPGQKNYILGLSTGARGAVLLSLDCPQIFKKGAGLSGDYDQTRMPKDALMTGYYGPFETYRDRWLNKDNVVHRFKELRVPLYLGHSKNDKIVPFDQTKQLADSLKKYKPGLIKYHSNDSLGHTYEYWNCEVDNVLHFFKADK